MRDTLMAALITLLLVTGHSLAMARADNARIEGKIVICMGHGIVMVHVDANGNPVGPPRFCPDGVLALFDASVAGPDLGAPNLVVRALSSPVAVSSLTDISLTEPRGRGPPYVI